MSRAPRLLAALVAALALLVAAPVAGAATPKKGVDSKNVYGSRYCEFLIAKGALPAITVDVFNTVGLNTCPASWWDPIQATTVARDQGAVLVVKNGPRFWLMDYIHSAVVPPISTFYGQRMRKVAQLKISTAGELARTPFTERKVYRDVNWTFAKGRRVYEVHSPDGKTYLMQAYSQIVDPTVTRANLLARVRSAGGLPAGWTVTTRRLKRKLVLKSTSTTNPAVITQDALQNTYQIEK